MALLGATFLAPVGPATPALPATGPSVPVPPVHDPAGAGAAAGASVASLATLGGVLAVAGQRRGRAGRAERAARRAEAKPLALPMLAEPAYRKLNDPLAAEMDAGFDPLNLALGDSRWGTGADTYYNFREAEIKHGRLAMLATVGWITSEELQAALARRLGLADELAPGELAPSLVNGGLNSLPSWFLPGVFAITALLEYYPSTKGDREATDFLKYKPQSGRVPGDLGFDPVGLQTSLGNSGYSVARLHNAEAKHGRAAMIAITAFVAQEYIAKVPVVVEDEVSADRAVALLDKGIDAVDAAAGLKIPDIPLPFPGL